MWWSVASGRSGPLFVVLSDFDAFELNGGLDEACEVAFDIVDACDAADECCGADEVGALNEFEASVFEVEA